MRPQYNERSAFTATIYTEPDEVPSRFWRLIKLQYPGGDKVCIVYAAEPAHSSELPHLMWQLQRAASAYSFEISLTYADGITTQAPPTSSGSRRGSAATSVQPSEPPHARAACGHCDGPRYCPIPACRRSRRDGGGGCAACVGTGSRP
jgi:hypothetical protein